MLLTKRIEKSVFCVVSIAQISSVTLVEAEGPAPSPAGAAKKSLKGNSAHVWLFQSNPALYDLRGALRSLGEQVWSASRYAKEIATGDRVYLWEAGPGGGIIGVAEIIEPAHLRPEPPEQLPFARVAQAFAGDRPRTRLRILRVVGPLIAKETILAHPELRSLGVVRCPRGTNFRLSLEEARALDGLMECVPQTAPPGPQTTTQTAGNQKIAA